MKKSKMIFLLFFVTISVATFFFVYNNSQPQEVLASSPQTVEKLKEKRVVFLNSTRDRAKDGLVNILIVPGHDDDYYGTEFEGVREVDLNRQLAKKLYDYLSKERGFNTVLVSDSDGYNSLFERYFDREKSKIKSYMKGTQKEFEKRVRDGEITLDGKIFHNSAPEDVAYKLYGINYWADKQNFDLVIHVHFNDYAGRYSDRNPDYSGFAIYIPDEQFKNHDLSLGFAKNIFGRLKNVSFVSNLEQEKGGIISDDQLIAIGSRDSLNAGALLIEYGYIYEPQFTDSETREVVLDEMAKQTYFGIKDFFDEKVEDRDNFVFQKDLSQRKYIRTKENFMLQKKLKELGFYPPSNKTERDCPIGGLFGDCTKVAVMNFQKNNKLPATGFVGEMTRKILNIL